MLFTTAHRMSFSSDYAVNEEICHWDNGKSIKLNVIIVMVVQSEKAIGIMHDIEYSLQNNAVK
jgi:hypothetical protein